MPSIRCQPWPDLLRCLAGVEGLAPLHAFAKLVSESRFAGGLFAYATMRTVALAQTRDIQDGQERLMVTYEPKHDRIHMAFTDWGAWDVDGPRPGIRGKDSWVRDYAPGEAWPAFLKFLRRVGWFPDADRA